MCIIFNIIHIFVLTKFRCDVWIEKCGPINNDKIMNVLAPEEKHIFKFKSLQVGTVDYRKLNIPEANAYTYVCGYLMKKCLEIHSCQVCVDYANCQKL